MSWFLLYCNALIIIEQFKYEVCSMLFADKIPWCSATDYPGTKNPRNFSVAGIFTYFL